MPYEWIAGNLYVVTQDNYILANDTWPTHTFTCAMVLKNDWLNSRLRIGGWSLNEWVLVVSLTVHQVGSPLSATVIATTGVACVCVFSYNHYCAKYVMQACGFIPFSRHNILNTFSWPNTLPTVPAGAVRCIVNANTLSEATLNRWVLGAPSLYTFPIFHLIEVLYVHIAYAI